MSCNCQKVYIFRTPVNGCNSSGFTDMFSTLPDGTYTINLDFLSGKQVIEITKAGATIETVGDVVLNENYWYTGKIFDASGAAVSLVFETLSYDCFMFQTEFIIS